MDYNTVAALHKFDASMVALRKDWLPLAISFFYYIFKRKHEVQVSQEVFQESLTAYLENLNATLPEDANYRQDANYYIDRWSREDDLLRIRNLDNGFVVQLSPHAERLVGWFEEMQNRGMVGTESRLRNILTLLEELVTQSTEDVETRLAQLHDRRGQIELEIKRIETTQQVSGLSDLQVRERLDHINSMARQLLRDFSLVEELFRDMARTIQQAQLNPQLRRGDILSTALDANEKLEASDEGQSFQAFYELLTHPQQREHFDALISALFSMPRLNDILGNHTILQRLTSYLLDAGERVNQSNQRLAEHLRRVVETRNITESRRVQALAQQIKHLVSQLGDELKPLMSTRQFLAIEGEPEVELPLERPLFEPPTQFVVTERPHKASRLVDDDAIMALYNTFYIDETLLEENITRLLMSRPQVTLPEVATSYPIQKGIAEVIAYVLIATKNTQHRIDRTQIDQVPVRTRSGETQLITIPRITFNRVRTKS